MAPNNYARIERAPIAPEDLKKVPRPIEMVFDSECQFDWSDLGAEIAIDGEGIVFRDLLPYFKCIPVRPEPLYWFYMILHRLKIPEDGITHINQQEIGQGINIDTMVTSITFAEPISVLKFVIHAESYVKFSSVHHCLSYVDMIVRAVIYPDRKSKGYVLMPDKSLFCMLLSSLISKAGLPAHIARVVGQEDDTALKLELKNLKASHERAFDIDEVKCPLGDFPTCHLDVEDCWLHPSLAFFRLFEQNIHFAANVVQVLRYKRSRGMSFTPGGYQLANQQVRISNLPNSTKWMAEMGKDDLVVDAVEAARKYRNLRFNYKLTYVYRNYFRCSESQLAILRQRAFGGIARLEEVVSTTENLKKDLTIKMSNTDKNVAGLQENVVGIRSQQALQSVRIDALDQENQVQTSLIAGINPNAVETFPKILNRVIEPSQLSNAIDAIGDNKKAIADAKTKLDSGYRFDLKGLPEPEQKVALPQVKSFRSIPSITHLKPIKSFSNTINGTASLQSIMGDGLNNASLKVRSDIISLDASFSLSLSESESESVEGSSVSMGNVSRTDLGALNWNIQSPSANT